MHDLAFTKDGRAAMGYVETEGTPWHGLGVPLRAGATLAEWNDAAFPWTLRRTPLFYAPVGADDTAGVEDTRTMYSKDGREVTIAVADREAIYRSDNGRQLGTVSPKYKLVQPSEILDFFATLVADQGMVIDTAGSLKDGAVYWVLAKTGQEANIRGDKHAAYVLLATSCNGSMANRGQFTDVRVVCNNTLQAATMGSSGAAITSRHSTEFDPEEFRRALGLVDFEASWFKHTEQLQRLAETPVSPLQAAAIVANVTKDTAVEAELAKVTVSAPAAEMLSSASKGASYSAERVAQDLAALKAEMAETMARMQAESSPARQEVQADASVAMGGRAAKKLWDTIKRGKGQDTDAAKGTAYGVLNGVTRWVDHERRAASADSRMVSGQFGDGARVKNRALEQLGELVEAA